MVNKNSQIQLRSVAREFIPFGALSRRGLTRVDPNEASIQLTSTGWPAPLTAGAFNRL